MRIEIENIKPIKVGLLHILENEWDDYVEYEIYFNEDSEVDVGKGFGKGYVVIRIPRKDRGE